ncbi:SDR family oxidoreductase [Sphingomonas sp.]|uniref:SDR family oxidoreductase n=1 Tax=Sphingomonas sp. TaxID=28214 RepID=UPI002DD6354B|nr:SDR family NAD(P)-dependent oxidoreductase [Sphingomonas sp.]
MKLNSSISAIVTGGGSGLGEATARALAAAGVRVAVFDFNPDNGARVAGEIGGTFCEVDVTSDASVLAGFAAARAAHGQERVLVNCAGGGGSMKTVSRSRETGEIAPMPIEHFRKVIEVNVIASFRCASLAAAGMLALDPLDHGERGVIVNTASAAAEDGQMGQAAYAAAKGGIVSMTLPIARDLGRDGVRINTILPGIFSTPPMRGVPEKVRTALEASVPFPHRMGEPSEYASLVLEMCRNPYLNGEDIRLDGAIRMGYSR